MQNVSTSKDVTQDTQIPRRLNDPQEIHRNTSSLPGGVVFSEKEADEVDQLRKPSRDRLAWFSAFVSKPFGEFAARAYEFHVRHADEDLEDETWRSDLFWFAWVIRGHEFLTPHLKKGTDLLGSPDPESIESVI